MRFVLESLVRQARMRKDPIGYARAIGVLVGDDCRLDIRPDTFGSEPYLIRLGNHVTVAPGVRFVTHDGGVWVFREQHSDVDIVAPIIVGNNVFIGMNSIILPGVRIGDDCVIGAGSVVTRDIPPQSVAVGVPARRIKSIEQYWEGVRDKAISTKQLSDSEKRKYLKERFSSHLSNTTSH